MSSAQNPSEWAALAANLDDVEWRLSHLYKIVAKGNDDDDDGLVIQFVPNAAQQKLIDNLWNRNLILKARQLGFSTLVCILWLDTALFSREPVRCGIIAQDREAAEALFRGKVKFAYDNLPPDLLKAMPLAKATQSELEFAHNGSSIRVATSMRSGTIHRLHVSEFGKICAKFPDKANEVVTGSIPAVPTTGVLVIESTAEGREGEFYKMTDRAMKLHQSGVDLSPKDYRFNFYPWFEAPEYSLDHDVILTEHDKRYFDELEGKIGRKLSLGQRAWYVVTREADFSGDPTKMWQEYPSTPEEAFQVSMEGCWYAEQMATMRKQGRIMRGIPVLAEPINTFWDLGKGDMTAIWFHQFATLQHRFIRYYEYSGEDLSHYAAYLRRLADEFGYVYGTHYLPHEADYQRLGESPDTNKTLKQMLEDLLPGQRFEIVPRVSNINAGIQATRKAMRGAYIDEEHCAQGIVRLDNYKKRWNKVVGAWSSEPLHDDNSHGLDAFRQWGQTVEAVINFASGQAKTFKRRGSGMAV